MTPSSLCCKSCFVHFPLAVCMLWCTDQRVYSLAQKCQICFFKQHKRSWHHFEVHQYHSWIWFPLDLLDSCSLCTKLFKTPKHSLGDFEGDYKIMKLSCQYAVRTLKSDLLLGKYVSITDIFSLTHENVMKYPWKMGVVPIKLNLSYETSCNESIMNKTMQNLLKDYFIQFS